jgi:hypothetical protein
MKQLNFVDLKSQYEKKKLNIHFRIKKVLSLLMLSYLNIFF